MDRRVDYEPLHAPVATADFEPHARTTVGAEVMLALIPALLSGLLGALVAVVVGIAMRSFGFALICVGIFALLGLFWAPFILASGLRTARRRVRLTRFAQANGFAYSFDGGPVDTADPLAEVGAQQSWVERVQIGAAVIATVTNQLPKRSYQTSRLVIPLTRTVPHLTLVPVAAGIDWASRQVSAEARAQIISLEGDFDRHFTLYAPRDYTTDALYIFTPDVMAALIDHASGFSITLIDDQLIVRPLLGTFDLTDDALWRRLFAVLDSVAPEVAGQTLRYRDERSEVRSLIAQSGRRLTGGLTFGRAIGVTAFLLGVAAVFVVPFLLDSSR